MRRILLLSVAAAAAAALMVVPTVALAHHRSHHRHARVRHDRIGSPSADPSTAAGTVDTFTGGVLTIKLSDGTLVSGTVTSETEIACQAPTTGSGGDDQGDDDSGDGQDCTTGDLMPTTPVQDAELALTGAGATWDSVDLVATPSTPGSGDGGDD